MANIDESKELPSLEIFKTDLVLGLSNQLKETLPWAGEWDPMVFRDPNLSYAVLLWTLITHFVFEN